MRTGGRRAGPGELGLIGQATLQSGCDDVFKASSPGCNNRKKVWYGRACAPGNIGNANARTEASLTFGSHCVGYLGIFVAIVFLGFQSQKSRFTNVTLLTS